jgi:hypothetical protein
LLLPPVFLSMCNTTDDVEVEVTPPREEGANAKASQEGTFDDAKRSKTVAVAVAALITVLMLVVSVEDFIAVKVM